MSHLEDVVIDARKVKQEEATTQDALMWDCRLAFWMPRRLLHLVVPNGFTGYFVTEFIYCGCDIKCLEGLIERFDFSKSCTGEIASLNKWSYKDKVAFLLWMAERQNAKRTEGVTEVLFKSAEIIMSVLTALVGIFSIKEIISADSLKDVLNFISNVIQAVISNIAAQKLSFLVALFLILVFLVRFAQIQSMKYLAIYKEALILLARNQNIEIDPKYTIWG